MFDPFGNLNSEGYLCNVEALKDLELIKIQEHLFFEANLEEALLYLNRIEGAIHYDHFLKVHEILFGEFYPWAGRDRLSLEVGRFVGKGSEVHFEASELCQRAVEWGLQMGNDPGNMQKQPGKVMGAFAWGHPFLDGNGRTMLLVHSELCHRAGFSINWSATRKNDYLQALTLELNDPGNHLDAYLCPFKSGVCAPTTLLDSLKALPGLDGKDAGGDQNIVYRADDQKAIETYLEMKRARGETPAS